ncbi:MAG: heme ABC exporter ATP-binding protein CcmA [Marmoricola sp.]
MSSTAVQARGLSVDRGRARVLHDLSFQVAPGEVVGLLGPSGCGKTTLMRTIVGIQAGVTGVIDVLGRPAGAASLRHDIGYVTQAPSIYADLSVRENLRFFARVLGLGSTEVDRVMETVDLQTHADRVVAGLSGGERSRVSLAVALLGQPTLLVLDEPTVGLDPVLRRALWSVFHDLADAGAAVIVSSHVMDEAERCDRLLLMRDGRFLAEGPPDEIVRSTGATNIEGAFLALVEGER